MIGDSDIFREAGDYARYQGEGEDDRPEQPDPYDEADRAYDAMIDAHSEGAHSVEPVPGCPECRKGPRQ